jgi:hypothetical protein
LRSARVVGSIALDVKTLSAAKALAVEWQKEIGGVEVVNRKSGGEWHSIAVPKKWTVEITNEKGETLWTL